MDFMLKREIQNELLILLTEYPVVTILGPRQSGKTTLAKETLKDYTYSNLEVSEERRLATEDSKAYLDQFKSKVIIDEIQRAPELLSYIQDLVDHGPNSGACKRFCVTVSLMCCCYLHEC